MSGPLPSYTLMGGHARAGVHRNHAVGAGQQGVQLDLREVGDRRASLGLV
jgi:hypothetical protein